MITLVRYTDPSSNGCCNGCTFKSPHANEKRTKNNIAKARQPEAAHGHHGIACPPEYTVDQEDHDDDHTSAQHDTGEGCAITHHFITCTHHFEDVWSEYHTCNAYHNRYHQRYDDCL